MQNLRSIAVGVAIGGLMTTQGSIHIDRVNNRIFNSNLDENTLKKFSVAAAIGTGVSALFLAYTTGYAAQLEQLLALAKDRADRQVIGNALKKVILPTIINTVASTAIGTVVGKLFTDRVAPEHSPTWKQAAFIKGMALFESQVFPLAYFKPFFA